mgnify:CR=1 FL=1
MAGRNALQQSPLSDAILAAASRRALIGLQASTFSILTPFSLTRRPLGAQSGEGKEQIRPLRDLAAHFGKTNCNKRDSFSPLAPFGMADLYLYYSYS